MGEKNKFGELGSEEFCTEECLRYLVVYWTFRSELKVKDLN